MRKGGEGIETNMNTEIEDTPHRQEEEHHHSEAHKETATNGLDQAHAREGRHAHGTARKKEADLEHHPEVDPKATEKDQALKDHGHHYHAVHPLQEK